MEAGEFGVEAPPPIADHPSVQNIHMPLDLLLSFMQNIQCLRQPHTPAIRLGVLYTKVSLLEYIRQTPNYTTT